jgi:hypothetical protein
VDTLKEQKSVTLRGLYRHQEITAHLMRDESSRAVNLLQHDIQRFIGLLDEGHISPALARLAIR